MHDDLGATTSYGFRDETAYGLVKFEATSDNFIRKVGTFVNASGAMLDIEIFDDFDGEDNLSNLLASSYGNIIKYPGYHTFDIPATVSDDFYVKVKYFTPDYSFPVPAETKISFQGEDYAIPDIEPSGFNWISKNGTDWNPLGNDIEGSQADLCIRAYADNSTALNPFFTADRTISCINSDIVFEDNSNGTINSYSWDFGEGATPATAATEGPHVINYNSAGKKTITLEISNSETSKTLTRKAYIDVVEELDIFLPYSELLHIQGDTVTITAFGADDYNWSPSQGLSSNEGASVNAFPADTTTYIVSGTMGACAGSASITLNVVENPVNDDVCDAIEFENGGYQGEFTNQYATVEAGEPSPPETEQGCVTDMEWCIEGGLHNSVWFKFIAPESGEISIDTRGMDNQIAVYKAKKCDSILFDNYELVAAFDDYHSSELYYAAAIAQLDVIPGEQYFVQVDGSAGGAEGEFDLWYYEWSLGNDNEKPEIDNSELCRIFPNPTEGMLDIILHINDVIPVSIKVYDLTGKLIYSDKYENIPGNLHRINLINNDPGIYYLELKVDNEFIRKSFVIR